MNNQSMHSRIAVGAWIVLSLFITAPIMLNSCMLFKHKEQPNPEPLIVAEVIAEPSPAKVRFKEKDLGSTPLSIDLFDVHDLTKLTARLQDNEPIETRFRYLEPPKMQVVFIFGEPSTMIKALGLAKITVFDYGDFATFDSGKYELKPEISPMLIRQAEVLNTYFADLDVYICGHTDNSGGKDFNLNLSLKRAQAVADFLVAHNVDKKRLKIQGFGEKFPLADDATPAGRAINRRTEIILPR